MTITKTFYTALAYLLAYIRIKDINAFSLPCLCSDGVHMLDILAQSLVIWLAKHGATKLVIVRQGETFFRLHRINRAVLQDLPMWARNNFHTFLHSLDELKKSGLKPCREWEKVATNTYSRNRYNRAVYVGDSINDVDIIVGNERVECKYIGGMFAFGGVNAEPTIEDIKQLDTILQALNITVI